MLRLLIIISLVAPWFVACASRPQTTVTNDKDPRAEIASLDRQINEMLQQRFEIQPFTATCAANQSCTDEPQVAPACSNSTPSCSDSCELGTSICKNAARICELAKQLGGNDAYANEKCQHGNESCAAACGRCTACRP